MDEIGQHDRRLGARTIRDKTSLRNKCHEKLEAIVKIENDRFSNEKLEEERKDKELLDIETDKFTREQRNEKKRHVAEASRSEHEHKAAENSIQTEHEMILTNLMSKFEVDEMATREAGECKRTDLETLKDTVAGQVTMLSIQQNNEEHRRQSEKAI